MYSINKQKYSDILLKQPERIFHTQDLGVLWNISNKNTLYMTISRYMQRGVLSPIYKGMYSTLPLQQLDPWLVGIKALHSYAYISCETALAYYGYINASPSMITLVSDKSKQLTIGTSHYRSRQLKDAFLFHPAGVRMQNGVRIASPERAIADMLYFNPRFHFDKPINWTTILRLQKLIAYPRTPDRYVAPTH